VPYLRFAASFPICSFSGVKCWYGDRLDVTVVTSHVTTAYNFAEKTSTNWLQTAKFAKVFSLETFPLYGTYEQYNSHYPSFQPHAMLANYRQGVSKDIHEDQHEPTFPLDSWLKPVVVIRTVGSCLFLTYYYS